MKARLLGVLLAFVLLGAGLGTGVPVRAGGLMPRTQDGFQKWVIKAPEFVVSGSTMKCSVDGPPPGTSADPPFKGQVFLNGWFIADVDPHYNPETGEWEFSVPIPSGAMGGEIMIWIHPIPTGGGPPPPSLSTQRQVI
ncbi:MAG: hypothetical protein H6807_06120 [Planctomycetes bacterium]|nr:hypothetical protein [Planctomycetota bacterium]